MLGGARMCISIEGKVTKFNAGHSSYSVHWCIYSYPMFVPLTTNLLAPRRKVLWPIKVTTQYQLMMSIIGNVVM